MNQPLQQPPDPKQQELSNKLAGFFKSKTPTHEPIIKSLEKIGVNPKVMVLPINEQSMDCLVIPIDLLMMKEYQYMSGVDIQAIHEVANMSIQPLREEQKDDNTGTELRTGSDGESPASDDDAGPV